MKSSVRRMCGTVSSTENSPAPPMSKASKRSWMLSSSDSLRTSIAVTCRGSTSSRRTKHSTSWPRIGSVELRICKRQKDRSERMASMYQCGGRVGILGFVVPRAVSLGEVLATLGQPSLVEWRRVVRALDELEDPAQLDAAEIACAHFPDKLRLAPGRWLRQLFEGKRQPKLRVTRAIDIALLGDDPSGDRLAWTDAPELAQVTIVRVYDEQFGD